MALFTNLSLMANTLQPLYCALLLKLRVNWNFSTIMIFYSLDIGSLGLLSIETEQLIEMTGLVILYFLSKIPIAFYLKDSLELLQLESGLNSSIFEVDFD